MKPEFKIGDSITYKPYEQAFDAQVRKVTVGTTMFGRQVVDDDRVFYHFKLWGRMVETSGKCIAESKLFQPWTEEEAKNFFK